MAPQARIGFMPRLKLHTWLTAAFGLVCSAAASASEPAAVLNADAAFQPTQQNWIQQVQCAEAPCADDFCAPGACDDTSGHCGGLCGDLGDPWDLSDSMFSRIGIEEPCWDIGGWLSAGYSNKADGVFSSVPHHLNLEQGWLYADKLADGSEGLDWGFRADVYYGTDGYFGQSYGNSRGAWDFQDAFDHGDYAWAIPQLNVSFAYHDLTIKIGHFFTMHGYEVVPALGRPLYSGAFSWFYSEPFTHTGVQAQYQVNDDLMVHACWVLGWDTGFDNLDGGNAFQPGFTATIIGDTTLSWFCTVGNNGWIGDGYTQSAVLTVPVNDKLTYIAVSDFINGNAAPFGGQDYHTISFYNYLLYSISDRTGVAGRAEWLKANGVSYYEITGGFNFKPCANMMIRPELRYQWSPGAEGGNNPLAIPSLGDAIFGVDATVTF
jgi:hypothetical protein